MIPAANEHAVYPNRPGHVPAGRCAYEMTTSRLGSTWSYCGKPATMRCTIAHGGEILTEDYCAHHYRSAKRRTRYNVVQTSTSEVSDHG